MFAKLLKIKFSETISKPPVIVSYVLSIILNLASFILVWYFSDKSFFHNSFVYTLVSFVVDFILIFLLCYYLFLDDMLNYNDVNYVSKSIRKGTIAWTKILLIISIIAVKAIIDTILIIIFMVSVQAETWEISSDVLVTLLGQVVFSLTLIPLFLFISLSKKTLSFIGFTVGLLLGVFGLSVLTRTALVDTSANNTLNYNREQNRVNYASIYNDTTEDTKIAVEENDPRNYEKNLNTDWRTSISNINKASDFMPSNLFFALPEVLYNAPSKYYQDIGFATKFTAEGYGFDSNRFVFNNYQKIKINNKDQLFFFNPQDVNVFKMNSIELGDFIIDSMSKMTDIDFKNDATISPLNQLYTKVTETGNRGELVQWSKLKPEELKIVADLLGMTNLNPSMFYIFMYGDQLLQRTPNILFKIESKFSTGAAKLFSALFLNTPAANAIVQFPSDEFKALKYNTVYNINEGAQTPQHTATNKEMIPYYKRIAANIPFPYIEDPTLPPLPSTVDFVKHRLITISPATNQGYILLSSEVKDSIYATFTNFEGVLINGKKIFATNSITEDDWVQTVDKFSKTNRELKEFYRALVEAAKSQTPEHILNVYGARASATDTNLEGRPVAMMWLNKYDVNSFSYTNTFTSIPYSNSATVFTVLNIILIPLSLYISIFCYKRISLDHKDS